MTQVRKRKGRNVRQDSRRPPLEKKYASFEINLPSTAQLRVTFFIIFLSTAIFFLGAFYVQTIHEKERSFSELSDLEREITFRSEMGFYYYFYKLFVKSKTWEDALWSMQHENYTEYPDTVNAIRRFHIMPEIAIGTLYKIFKKFNFLNSAECAAYKRDDGFSYDTCIGLGEPVFFYLQFAWYSAGFTTLYIFLFGLYLSKSIYGGLISTLAFFYNHVECSRVQWTPPLRETFGYPLILLQILVVTVTLDEDFKLNQFRPYLGRYSQKVDKSLKHYLGVGLHMLLISLLTFFALVAWQFSQFVFIIQILVIMILFIIREVSVLFVALFSVSCLFGVFLAMLIMQYNEMLLSSGYTFFLVSSIFFIIVTKFMLEEDFYKRSSIMYSVPFGIMVLSKIFPSKDDTHIYDLLNAKFNEYKDFHTLLYTCSIEYNFLPVSVLLNLTYTALLPLVVLIMLRLFFVWLKSVSFDKLLGDIQLPVAYNVIQACAFCAMAGLFMRLKLFSNPHLCILVALYASKYMPAKMRQYNITFLSVLTIAMSYQGVANVLREFSNFGTFAYPPMEDLLNFVSESTPGNAVFAGPISVMASVVLSTRRPVVVHPHYEHSKIRNRTKEVYSVFSRKSEAEIYGILNNLHVDYVILDYHWCYTKSSIGCLITDAWDLEDVANRNKKSFCSRVFEGVNIRKFVTVYRNEVYRVLKLKKLTHN